MIVAVLASGSRGNATYIKMDGTEILIDFGIATRRVVEELERLNTSLDNIQAVFITHEHTDHINGLKTFAKRYKTPIYSNSGTMLGIPFYDDVKANWQMFHGSKKVGKLIITPYSVPHDALDTVCYTIEGSRKVAVVTDLGYLPNDVRAAIDGADILTIEANYDEAMLKAGNYPVKLKRRIMSDTGHLSNTATGEAIVSLKKPPKYAILTHLSQENNTPKLALDTVKQILLDNKVKTTVLLSYPKNCQSIEMG